MKYMLFFLLSVSVIAKDNPYSIINKRNAFDLAGDLPPSKVIVDKVETPKIELFLTGVTRWRGDTKAHLYSKDLPNKYMSLRAGEQLGPIKVLSVSRDGVRVNNNGTEQVLTFASNRLKTTIISVKGKPTVIKKDGKESSSRGRSSKDEKSKKPTVTTPKASIVKVPSRQPKVDPRIIERGLEYLNKMEDGDRKDYLLKRIESLQSGQYQIKSDIDQNERRRQYDEWRKRRDK